MSIFVPVSEKVKSIHRITPEVPPVKGYLSEVWKHRALILTLAKREIKSRYAQTYLGLLVAVIQPLVALTIFTIFFDGFIQLETGKIAYPVFAFSGMILWYFFSTILNGTARAVIDHQDLIQKVYFPKLILPISKLIGALFEFAIGFVLFLVLALAFRVSLSSMMIFVPIVVLLTAFTAFSCGLLLSALSVKRRDVVHIVTPIVNYAIWLTPVFYPVQIVPEQFRDLIYYLNPIASSIHFFRGVVLNTPIEWMYLLSYLWVLILFIIGFHLFRKAEQYIPEYV